MIFSKEMRIMRSKKRVKVFDIIGSPSALTVEQGKLLYNEIINILKDEELAIHCNKGIADIRFRKS